MAEQLELIPVDMDRASDYLDTLLDLEERQRKLNEEKSEIRTMAKAQGVPVRVVAEALKAAKATYAGMVSNDDFSELVKMAHDKLTVEAGITNITLSAEDDR